MEIFFAPMQPFVMHAERIGAVAFAFFVAAVFVLAVKRRVSWWLVVAAASWALFAWWEHYCTVNKFNIRVDLMFIAPMLYSITIGGLWGLVEPWLLRRQDSDSPLN